MKTTRRTIKKRFREPDTSPVLRIIAATIGPGKARLLEHIHTSGSLSQAARDMDLTYRQAWTMLDEMNHVFREPLVASFTGGTKGGGMRLTAPGLKALALYQEIQSTCDQAAATPLRKLHRLLRDDGQT